MAHSFSLISWNVLADMCAQTGGFVGVEPDSLEWNHRVTRFRAFFAEYQADVICLQECNHFNDFWHPLMQEFGYTATYAPKTKSPAMQYHPALGDGVVIFYRPRFQLIKSVTYGETPVQAIVWLKDGDRELCVSTVHLKAKQGYEEVRYQQAITAVDRMRQVTCSMEVPMILCGDFNATADEQCITELTRVLADTQAGADWTTWKTREATVKRTIDYIFCSEYLDPVNCLKITAVECPETGLPTALFPSDHIPIGYSFIYNDM